MRRDGPHNRFLIILCAAAMLAAGGCGRFATSWSAPAAQSAAAAASAATGAPSAVEKSQAPPASTSAAEKTPAAVAISRQWDFATGLEGLLPTGATWQLSQDWTWLRSNNQFITPNPQYDGDLVLSVTQPLLRGGGVEYTRSPIVLARLDEKISNQEFRGRLMDIVLEVERTY
ncbi:MAG: hypothetical protein NTY65_03495 [Planctomycetota bacterium]|nr:hypothetical protein [Planctomycetota bacterium]